MGNYDELPKLKNISEEDAEITNPHCTLNITRSMDENTMLVSNNIGIYINILTFLIHTFALSLYCQGEAVLLLLNNKNF